MTRKKKMMMNVTIGGLYQIITIICNFILPKFYLRYYGSSVNGLVSSISQFLTMVTLCECGVGAVVQSAMYKPLAENDDNSLSEIVISSNSFFRKIIYILIVYTVGLMIFYPLITINSFDYLYTAALIMILSFSYFAQYYFFLTYRLLLNADQLGFIHLMVHSIALIVNTILSIVLIKAGTSVHIVKLMSSLVFICQPIALRLYVHKHYSINLKLKLHGEPIKQKWNGFAQHIASIVLTNTDTAVLTLFSTLENVSIYSIYYLVVHGLRSLLLSMTTGIQAMFGNMYAKKEIDLLSDTFTTVTWIMNFSVTTLFTIAGIMLVPFVSVYTHGVTDANYIQPIFAVIITLAYAMYCIRLPYNMLVFAAGRYKQTQWSSIIEATLNIMISVILISNFGINGVAAGTLFAMLYRTTYFAFYISKHIIKKRVSEYFKHLIIDAIVVIISAYASKLISLEATTYISLIIAAIKVGIICLIINIVINIIFYRKMFVKTKNYLIRIKAND